MDSAGRKSMGARRLGRNVMTGMLAAANILAGQTLYDVWQVNEDAEYSEAGFSGAEHALQSERLVPHRAAATRAA